MDLEEIMDYVKDSNECFHINLTRPTASGKPKRIFDESFNPTFTYALFGEDQKLLGYKEPKILLDFRANDALPTLDISYKEKHDGSRLPADVKQSLEESDIEEPFHDILPEATFDSDAAARLVGPDPTSASWTPPGKLLRSFRQEGREYEIWTANLSDPVALQIFRNMQIFVLLFIEGGSQLELDEDWTLERWTLYLLYDVTPQKDASISPYTLAGFCTSYRYWIFPTNEIMRATKSLPSPPASSNGDAGTTKPRLTQDPVTFKFNEHIDPLHTQSRERISQFIILPPFQNQQLGSKLYDTIYADLVKLPNIYEVAVEDPSEAFDVMRDYSDLMYLRKLPAFQSLSIPSELSPDQLRKDAPIPRDLILGNGADLDAFRHEVKIVPRQFNRVLEMHLLSTIPAGNRSTARITRKAKSSDENDRKFYFWRLAIKDRIYRQSADVLDQIEDAAEKVQLIENSLSGVVDEYLKRLAGLEKRERAAGNEEARQNGEASRAKRKRVVIEDEDEDDMDTQSVASSKKVRS